MATPSRPRANGNHCLRAEKWTPYPPEADETTVHAGCVLENQCKLNIIAHEICRTLFYNGNQRDTAPAEINRVGHELYKQLNDWRSALPECIERDKVPLPQILYIQ